MKCTVTTITVPRALSVTTNPAGLLAAAGAVAAAVTMLVNALNHHGLIDPTVIVAAVAAVGALLTRHIVTPTADPKSAAGVPLVPLVPSPAVTVPAPAIVPAIVTVPPPAWPSAVRLVPPGEKKAGPAAPDVPPPPVVPAP